MWNVKILKANRFGTSVEITYELSNGSEVLTFTAIGNTRESLEKAISQRIADLEKADTLIANIQNIVGDYVPAPIDNTDTRTQAERDFEADITLLHRISNAVYHKILLDTDAQVTTVRNRIRTALTNNPSWIKYF